MNANNNAIKVALEEGCFRALKDICIVTYIYMVYKQLYYLGKPIVTDEQFDAYEVMLKEYWPDNPALECVGLVYPKCKCCEVYNV
jgi:hypothetical protein